MWGVGQWSFLGLGSRDLCLVKPFEDVSEGRVGTAAELVQLAGQSLDGTFRKAQLCFELAATRGVKVVEARQLFGEFSGVSFDELLQVLECGLDLRAPRSQRLHLEFHIAFHIDTGKG